MKNITILLLMCFLTAGCGIGVISNNLSKVEVTNNLGAKDTLLEGKVAKVKIDGYDLDMLFDTGAAISFIYDINKIGGRSILNDENHIVKKGKGADGEFETTLYFTKSISLNSSQSVYQPLGSIPHRSSANACKNIQYDGVLGLDAFYKSENPVLLDFNDNTISIVNHDVIVNGYYEIPSEFKSGVIYIKAEIAGAESEFLFDTGADADLIITKENKNLANADLNCETIIETGKGISEKKLKIYQATVGIGENIKENSIVYYNETIHSNIIGFKFISKFNWIIDFNNKKLYAKKIGDLNTSERLKDIVMKNYKASVLDNKLIVSYKLSGANDFKLMDEIISVKNVKVTSSNICEIMSTLNDTPDWNDMKVVVKDNISKT